MTDGAFVRELDFGEGGCFLVKVLGLSLSFFAGSWWF